MLRFFILGAIEINLWIQEYQIFLAISSCVRDLLYKTAACQGSPTALWVSVSG
jgi:hypothetical protein